MSADGMTPEQRQRAVDYAFQVVYIDYIVGHLSSKTQEATAEISLSEAEEMDRALKALEDGRQHGVEPTAGLKEQIDALALENSQAARAQWRKVIATHRAEHAAR